MPVTGPYRRVVSLYSIGLHKDQTWYRQTPPYVEPLTFTMYTCRTKPTNPTSMDVNGLTVLSAASGKPEALNRAYEKFKNKLTEKAELGVNLAERRQAYQMILSRVIQIGRFSKHLKRMEFGKAMETLGWKELPNATPKRKINTRTYARNGQVHNVRWKRGAKSFANNFLEVHFGWSPLIRDIGAAVNTLQNGVPDYKIRARGVYSYNVGSKTPPPDGYSSFKEWFCSVDLKANVSVSDSNLWLANQLGFVNPLGLLWEIVPFSFVVDWFTNVGAFLSQYSDFVGLTIRQSQTTYYTKLHDYSYHNGPTLYYPPRAYKTTVYLDRDNLLVQRIPGISKPALLIKPFRGLSTARGATAISLLVQMWKPHII